MKKRSVGRGILNGMAQTLNFVGRSAVYTYDSGRLLFGRSDEIRLQRALTKYERARKKLQALEEQISALKKPKQAKTKPQGERGKLEAVIAGAVKSGEFDVPANQAIFEQVATDLLDENLQIRILAVQELGKIGNKAAMPILVEAMELKLPELTAEIKKVLAGLGDDTAPDGIAEPAEEREGPDAEPTKTEERVEEQEEEKPASESVPEKEPEEPADEEEEEEEEEEEDGQDVIALNKNELIKLRKKKLLSLCKDLGIKGDDTMTKSALTALILAKK